MRSLAAVNAVSATGLVEGHAPLSSAEEGLRRPKADVLPAAPEPVDAIRTGLKVLECDARRTRTAFGHQGVVRRVGSGGTSQGSSRRRHSSRDAEDFSARAGEHPGNILYKLHCPARTSFRTSAGNPSDSRCRHRGQ
jgi:hypothetical protein